MCGPIEVVALGWPVESGGPRGRSVVAALLLGPNRVVSIDHLVATVWGDDPPGTARVQVQNRVSRLRRAFAGYDASEVIVTSGSGYRINVREGQLDAHRFDQLVAEPDVLLGEADHAAARAALTDGLALWRGAALDGLSAPSLVAAARRLDERRSEAEAKRIEIDLLAGLDSDVLPELTALVGAHPYRERLRGYLMLALFRAGRRAAEHALRLVRPPVLPAGPASVRSPDAVLVPRQLPANLSAFTGRGAELDVLDELLNATDDPVGRHRCHRGDRRHARGRQDRASGPLGAPGRRSVPGRAAVCQPARLPPPTRRCRRTRCSRDSWRRWGPQARCRLATLTTRRPCPTPNTYLVRSG